MVMVTAAIVVAVIVGVIALVAAFVPHARRRREDVTAFKRPTHVRLHRLLEGRPDAEIRSVILPIAKRAGRKTPPPTRQASPTSFADILQQDECRHRRQRMVTMTFVPLNLPAIEQDTHPFDDVQQVLEVHELHHAADPLLAAGQVVWLHARQVDASTRTEKRN
jgi:hypothetical protein